MKKPYLLKKRNGIYYCKLAHEITYHSTGERTGAKAHKKAISWLHGDSTVLKQLTLKEFTKNLFVWEKCDWVKRQHKKGRKLTKFTAQMKSKSIAIFNEGIRTLCGLGIPKFNLKNK